jgi:hypothetical protein
MKTALLGIVTIVLLAGVVWSRAQTPADRPPGVDPDRWIPLTDSVGIVVLSTTGGAPLVLRNFSPPVDIPFGSATGRLMARHNGQWLAFDELGSTEARLHPAL